ncbi:MAG: hypothetical protein ACYCZQ_03210 [Burkholderiales bacterium]
MCSFVAFAGAILSAVASKALAPSTPSGPDPNAIAAQEQAKIDAQNAADKTAADQKLLADKTAQTQQEASAAAARQTLMGSSIVNDDNNNTMLGKKSLLGGA